MIAQLRKKIPKMSEISIPSFQTLAVYFVYRILDYLDDFDIVYSMRNVSRHINRIVDNYTRDQIVAAKCHIFILFSHSDIKGTQY